jgi:hypothetical protein
LSDRLRNGVIRKGLINVSQFSNHAIPETVIATFFSQDGEPTMTFERRSISLDNQRRQLFESGNQFHYYWVGEDSSNNRTFHMKVFENGCMGYVLPEVI